ncbi:hypothetical protein ACORG1_22950 [Mycobacterium sp. TJFP1]
MGRSERRKAEHLQDDAPFRLADAAFNLNGAEFRQDDLPCNLPEAAHRFHEEDQP